VTLILLMGTGYLIFVACVLALLTVAKRSDEYMEHQSSARGEFVATDHAGLVPVAARVGRSRLAESDADLPLVEYVGRGAQFERRRQPRPTQARGWLSDLDIAVWRRV
jgi:hypothetical protein